MDEPLWRDEVDSICVPVQRVVDGPISVCVEGETMIVSLLEEVVEKRLLTEELSIRCSRLATASRGHVYEPWRLC